MGFTITTDIEWMRDFEDIYLTVDLIAFHNRLPFIRLYSFLECGDYFDKSALAGAFVADHPNHKIFLNTEYLKRKPLKESINVIHHEMTHLYCELQGICDTEDRDGINYHKKAFRDAVKGHGGICHYIDNRFGWCDSELTPENMKKVKEYLEL